MKYEESSERVKGAIGVVWRVMIVVIIKLSNSPTKDQDKSTTSPVMKVLWARLRCVEVSEADDDLTLRCLLSPYMCEESVVVQMKTRRNTFYLQPVSQSVMNRTKEETESDLQIAESLAFTFGLL